MWLCASFFLILISISSPFQLKTVTKKNRQNNHGRIKPGMMAVTSCGYLEIISYIPCFHSLYGKEKNWLITHKAQTHQLIPSQLCFSTTGNRKEMSNMSHRNEGTQESVGSLNLAGWLEKKCWSLFDCRCDMRFWGSKHELFTSLSTILRDGKQKQTWSALCKDTTFRQEWGQQGGEGGGEALLHRSFITIKEPTAMPAARLIPRNSPFLNLSWDLLLSAAASCPKSSAKRSWEADRGDSPG